MSFLTSIKYKLWLPSAPARIIIIDQSNIGESRGEIMPMSYGGGAMVMGYGVISLIITKIETVQLPTVLPLALRYCFLSQLCQPSITH